MNKPQTTTAAGGFKEGGETGQISCDLSRPRSYQRASCHLFWKKNPINKQLQQKWRHKAGMGPVWAIRLTKLRAQVCSGHAILFPWDCYHRQTQSRLPGWTAFKMVNCPAGLKIKIYVYNTFYDSLAIQCHLFSSRPFNYQEFRLPYFFILVTHVHVDQLHVKSSYVIYSCHCPLACEGEDSST